jgi:hypothetical protein
MRERERACQQRPGTPHLAGPTDLRRVATGARIGWRVASPAHRRPRQDQLVDTADDELKEIVDKALRRRRDDVAEPAPTDGIDGAASDTCPTQRSPSGSARRGPCATGTSAGLRPHVPELTICEPAFSTVEVLAVSQVLVRRAVPATDRVARARPAAPRERTAWLRARRGTSSRLLGGARHAVRERSAGARLRREGDHRSDVAPELAREDVAEVGFFEQAVYRLL